MIMHNPYIGISGVTTHEEVKEVLHAALNNFTGRPIAIGVLVSEATLHNKTNRLYRRYPFIGQIKDIFLCRPNRLLNVLHYSTKSFPGAFEMGQLWGIGGRYCDGFQFNGVWPSPSVLGLLREYAPERRYILQLRTGFTTISELATMIGRLEAYRGIATDVLLDASCGNGLLIPPAWATAAVDLLKSNDHGMGIGIAGGLCAERIPDIADLLRAGVSIDAEGCLRDETDGGGRLSIDAVNSYIAACASVLQETKETP